MIEVLLQAIRGPCPISMPPKDLRFTWPSGAGDSEMCCCYSCRCTLSRKLDQTKPLTSLHVRQPNRTCRGGVYIRPLSRRSSHSISRSFSVPTIQLHRLQPVIFAQRTSCACQNRKGIRRSQNATSGACIRRARHCRVQRDPDHHRFLDRRLCRKEKAWRHMDRDEA